MDKISAIIIIVASDAEHFHLVSGMCHVLRKVFVEPIIYLSNV
jgi:hypothetical protein